MRVVKKALPVAARKPRARRLSLTNAEGSMLVTVANAAHNYEKRDDAEKWYNFVVDLLTTHGVSDDTLIIVNLLFRKPASGCTAAHREIADHYAKYAKDLAEAPPREHDACPSQRRSMYTDDSWHDGYYHHCGWNYGRWP